MGEWKGIIKDEGVQHSFCEAVLILLKSGVSKRKPVKFQIQPA